MFPVIIVGAGHNGLAAAYYLAKAGLRPLVCERRATVGGAAITAEMAPGFRCPTLAHATGPVRASVVRDMRLTERGVEFIKPDPRLLVPDLDGRALTFNTDESRTLQSIRAFSTADATKYPDFCATLGRLAGFIAPMLEQTPPSISGSSTGDLWELLKLGRRFRGLGRRDGYRLLRWLPMAAADLVGEWFTTEPLQAAIAARGIFGTGQGPRSAGTGAVLLMNAGADPVPGGSTIVVKGGPGALTAAMAEAAREAGAEIRTSAPVARVLVRDGRAAGVVLENGTELGANTVVSNADPRRTFLDLVDPMELDPGFLTRIRNYRSKGTTAKINLALSGLPVFRGATNPADLRGRIHIGPSLDYLERAFDASKYGQFSPEPYLEITMPTLHDDSMAPAGAHVMSVYMQFAPWKLAAGRNWADAAADLSQTVVAQIDRFAPGFPRLVAHTQVITPDDLDFVYGLSGGHILHGEPALDQLFTMRPVLGWAQYRTPVGGLYMCGAGTHPGGGLTAAPGQNAAREILRDLKR